MPHSRSRYLHAELKKCLKWSSTISLLGMRQVGKTTLLKEFSKDYFTFDDSRLLLAAEASEWGFVDDSARPTGLDECQKCPPVFDRVKLAVDQTKRPGQFILSGSVRFLSKKDIRESLTGRTAILELLPFTLSETHSDPLSPFLERCLNKKKTFSSRYRPAQIDEYLEKGGLPGICFKRDQRIRRSLFQNQIETLLSRDISFIAPTKLGFLKIKNLLTEVLRQSGTPLNKAGLARTLSTSGPTIDRLLNAFEALFIIKKHGSSYYGIDLGLSEFLTSDSNISERRTLLRLVYVELLAQLSYGFPNAFQFDEYKTRGGIDVPFLISIHGKGEIAICVDVTEQASEKSLIGLTWLKKKRPGIKTVALHSGNKSYVSAAGHICIPFSCVF